MSKKPINNPKMKENYRTQGQKDNMTDYSFPKYQDRFQTKMAKQVKPDKVKGNDISFHNKSPLYVDATKVPFNVIPGLPTEPIFTELQEYGDFQGVTIVDFVPSIGYAKDMNSPVNRAFNAFYSQIAQHTTGALQMQQMDLAFLTVGGSSIACTLGYAKSIMGLSKIYSKVNGYMPRYLIESLGIDFDDTVSNWNRYRVELNDLIMRFNNLCIPNFSSVFTYHYSVAHNTFCDEDSQYGQIIKFRPSGIYIFDDMETKLAYTPMNYTNMGGLLEYIERSLLAWENTSVYPIVKGNLMRFYNDSEFFNIELLTADYFQIPHVDRDISYQINNMVIHPVSTLSITQDPVKNILKFTPSWEFDNIDFAKIATSKQFIYLNSHDGNTSPDFIMEATRMIPQVSTTVTEASGKYYAPLTSVCNIIPTKADIIRLVRDKDTGVLKVEKSTITDTDIVILPDEEDRYAKVLGTLITSMQLAKFRNAPRIYFTDYSSGDLNTGTVALTGDVYRSTHLHQDQLDLLHLADMQSMYWLGATGTETSSLKSSNSGRK